ncbi:MAG: thioredoxin-disulfide reductase [Lachnospiraceae bacterium]|nr:thioredoxin-disulfide reductase [Lachnospiraceae bacterium]
MNENRKRKDRNENMNYDIIIIGAGPAGLTAAIYASRARLKGLVIEQKPMGGGQVLNTYEVDNYPGLPGIDGFELGTKLKEHAQQAGAVFEEGDVCEITESSSGYVVKTNQQEYSAYGVLIAAGAAHRLLDVEGEKELTGHGVSYCATCDGAFFRDKIAAVIGGGDVALEDAIFLSRICKKVFVIHRRDQFRGAQVLQERLLSLENVEILWDTIVEKIAGEDLVEELHIANVKTGEKKKLSVQGVFIAVGIQPESQAFRQLAEMDSAGYFIAGEDCRTSRRGIYAAGDIRTKQLRQIITAAADGANAITSFQEDFLQILDK